MEPATIVSDAAEGLPGSQRQGPNKQGTRDRGNKERKGTGAESKCRGIIAYCEEAVGGLRANVSREPNDPFRGARQLVARNADKDGEAIVLDLHF